MSSDQWSVKYRPKTLSEFVGQPAATAFIKGLVSSKRIPGCMLISGPSGIGKTTYGRLIAGIFSGFKGDPDKNPDLNEAFANVDTGKDDVKDLITKSRYSPRLGKRRCILVDEAHAYKGPAASALLKACEEPYAQTTWILCTDQPEKLPHQLSMRAQSIALGIVPDADIIKLMKWVLREERRGFGPKEDIILKRLASAAYGIPRQAIQLLDSVNTTLLGGGQPSEAIQMAIKTASVTESFDGAIQFIKAIADNNPKIAIQVLASSGTCDGMLELIMRMLTACAYVANGNKPKDGFGWAATKAIGRLDLERVLTLQTRVIAALNIRISSGYQVTSESLLLSLARK